jgi:pimeloyl-ACP methyl ester carboxylesterase
MNKFYQLSICTLLLLSVAASPLRAGTQSDTAKEKRWSEQIVDQLIDGEDVWLEARKHRFLTIYTPAETSPPLGTVLLVHGTGAHPDWPQVIQPLRSGLAENGWQSLSIQMPLPPEGADKNLQGPLIQEGADRIRAGLDWLVKQGAGKVTLISHSRGGADLLFYAADRDDDRIESLVVIGVNGAFKNVPDAMGTLQSLSRIKRPVLDIYGDIDLQGVLDTAAARQKAAHDNNPGYRQTEVAGADHFFEGMDAELLALVVDWLKTNHASNE